MSTTDQNADNQVQELRRFAEAREWETEIFIDHGVSGSREQRPALDRMMKAVRRRHFDAVACWKLDRLGRNLRHLVLLADELTALGVALVSLGESIDATTPTGRLALHMMAAFAEFERSRIRERVLLGLSRARAEGKRLGRPLADIPVGRLRTVEGLIHAEAALRLGVSTSTIRRWRRVQKTLTPTG